MTVTKKLHFDIRRKIVANMTAESWHDIPHVTYVYEPDVTEFMKTLKQLNSDSSRKNKITVNTVMLKVIAEGLKAAPECNAHIEYNAKYVKGTIKYIKEIDISVPWVMPNGEMMTINLHNIGERSLDNIAELMLETAHKIEKTDMTEAMFSVSMDNTLAALRKGQVPKVLRRLIGAKVGHSKVVTLKGKAKKEYDAIPESDRITLKDIEQGTVTVSNIGSVYREQHGAMYMLEIIPPQVFTIGLGAAQKKPVVITDENDSDTIAIRSVMPMCLAFDHRALDFAEIVPFMKRLDDIFEHPEQILGW